MKILKRNKDIIHLKIFPALAEDINVPYVWLSETPDKSRPLMRIENFKNGKTVYVQALRIDNNFRSRYQNSPNTLSLPEDGTLAVMSQWYRDCLGVKRMETTEFIIKPACWIFRLFTQLRASFSHPDCNVRLAANLAIISIFLGILGLLLGVISLLK